MYLYDPWDEDEDRDAPDHEWPYDETVRVKASVLGRKYRGFVTSAHVPIVLGSSNAGPLGKQAEHLARMSA